MSNWTTMIPKTEERILCAAIWYKDAEHKPNQPVNIDQGIVLAGWRHGCIIAAVKGLVGLRTVQFGPDCVGETIQGFITSQNRFLDRDAARALFVKQGFSPEFEQLYSEDLY